MFNIEFDNGSNSGHCDTHNRLDYSGCYCDTICEQIGDCCISQDCID